MTPADTRALTPAELAALPHNHTASHDAARERIARPTDQYGETAIDRLTDYAENGTMQPQLREDLRSILAALSTTDASVRMRETQQHAHDCASRYTDAGCNCTAIRNVDQHLTALAPSNNEVSGDK